jgi:glycosyltransferase involved in cell wall biosynthesis
MAQTKPLISFVVPVYQKSPEVLEKCLKSLRDMSYKPIEIIVVFDGKQDDMRLYEIPLKYTKPELFVEIEHGGAPVARNAGYRYATGTYVSFWDADCYAKPEMAKRWIQEFEESKADFVYSGYEFLDKAGTVASHPFDPWMLTCGNYIATMFPMKREIFPGFDESLEGAQDWDLWLTLAEKGFVGSYIAGEGFVTEPPSPESISGKAWNNENYRRTFDTIKHKHHIPDREIVICSEEDSIKGSHIARLMGNADFHTQLDPRRGDYKLAFCLGISFQNILAFEALNFKTVKVLYWRSKDIEAFENYGLLPSINLLEKFKSIMNVHYVNEIMSQKRLKRIFDFMGYEKPTILSLPSDVEEAETKLPESFRVLLDIDEMYMPVFRTVKQDMPYIRIDDLNWKTNPMVNVSDYSLLLSFQKFPTVNESIRRFLINGRNVISNVSAPYCGLFDMEVNMKDFKTSLIERIRESRQLAFNQEAQDFYKAQVSPEYFASKIKALLPVPEMEVVS